MAAPRFPLSNTLDVAASLGKTALQITAQFAPVPALGPVADLICGIIQLCQNVPQNRHAACQLRDRCHRLGLVVYDKAVANENVTTALASVTECLQKIHAKMDGWAHMNKVQSFLRQDEIVKDIESCHNMLTDCITSFQFVSQTEIHDWQAQFKLVTEEDHRELVSFLVKIENSQTITNAALQAQRIDIQRMMAMMQELMVNTRMANQQYTGLSSNLYDLQFKSQELLPDFHLRSGEVIRVGQFPISGTSGMDIYQGLYLGRERVDIKVLRAVNSTEDSMRRFRRECDVWKEVWKIDQGKHVLPFYGFCHELDGGSFPCMVSPWQANGTALTYIKTAGDKVDYLKLVKGVALGLQVLHSMKPPVVHGDIKAANVLIDVTGNPLIADFGFSRIVEDITGISFSQSRGVGDSYRWFAPELCIGEGVLSPSSDVYAYGMTVLEILTHEHPYSNIKHTPEVVMRAAKGEHPPRPTDPRVTQRGLDDKLWALLVLCWATQPAQRPTIQDVLKLFPEQSVYT
ncbi:kinase-like domain-containing protein [Mycena galopus ATCC 62051]|nr:kinase-like domain-containing protein [Mycena galopus ATCC 62051]